MVWQSDWLSNSSPASPSNFLIIDILNMAEDDIFARLCTREPLLVIQASELGWAGAERVYEKGSDKAR